MNTDSDSLARLVILGAGGHAAVVVESARRAGFEVVGIASTDAPDAACGGTAPFDAPWLGDPDGAGAEKIASMAADGARMHAAVGDPATRARWRARFGDAAFATVVDPSAIVSPSAHLAAGAFVGARAVVQARATIGACAIVNTGAIVEHDSTIGACAHIAPGAVLAGAVRVGDGAFVGAGAVVIPVRRIGAGATVGAGAVVVHDVAEGATVAGVPARVLARA